MHSEVRDKNPQVVCNTLSVLALQSLKVKSKVNKHSNVKYEGELTRKNAVTHPNFAWDQVLLLIPLPTLLVSARRETAGPGHGSRSR
jgi:hypothetical protein